MLERADAIKVIHFSTKSYAKETLAALLSETPRTPPEAGQHTSVATYDYSRLAQALVFGGGFTPEDLANLRKGIAGQVGFRSVPWLGGDPDRVQAAFKEYAGNMPGYIAHTSQRVRVAIQELHDQGKLGHDEGLYYF